MSRAIKFVMDEVTYKRLNSIANRNNSSMAHVVRELIHMSIDTREEWELPKLVPQQENPANK